MNAPNRERAETGPAPAVKPWQVGCVSYLNAKPLIGGLDDAADTDVRYDVPARLLDDLEAGEVDIALCPVIDYCRSSEPLVIVPSGGIGSDGSTLTVRLFSKTPIDRVTTVYADTDSHTSVALLRVLMHAQHGRVPTLIDYDAHEPAAQSPETMLLIGDKVVTDSPKAVEYPHQLDLGRAWHDLTGQPFVFAVWMSRLGVDLGDLPEMLAEQRRRNLEQIDAIVARHAEPHGWPPTLAQEYLQHILHFDVGPRELEAIRRFFDMAAPLGLIERARPIQLYEPSA